MREMGDSLMDDSSKISCLVRIIQGGYNIFKMVIKRIVFTIFLRKAFHLQTEE